MDNERFYREAARLLQRALERRASVKSLAFHDSVQDKKKMFAVLCQTLKFKETILHVMEQTRLLDHEPQLENLAMLLLHDFLFAKGIKCGGSLKASVHRHKDQLRAAFNSVLSEKGLADKAALQAAVEKETVNLPRYARVNTLKISRDALVKRFAEEGYLVLQASEGTDQQTSKGKTIRLDPDVDDLVVFPPGTDLHEHKAYLSGDIILQDKASCFPAFILSPPPGSHAIDACAAPGNKTSHLAARMKGRGKVFAFELDPVRMNTMQRMLSKAGVQNVHVQCKDFLTVDPSDPTYAKVEYILLDPSCSGSGISYRLDHLIEDESSQSDSANKERLRSLSDFQKAAILHAFQFPAVRSITYSTCSIHAEENEMVVEHVLSDPINTSLAHPFRLAPALPSWHRRGLAEYPGGDLMLRTNAEQDQTIGFFVALFTRDLPKSDSDKQEDEAVGEDAVVENSAASKSSRSVSSPNLVKKQSHGNKRKRGADADPADHDVDVASSQNAKRSRVKNSPAVKDANDGLNQSKHSYLFTKLPKPKKGRRHGGSKPVTAA